MGNVVNAHQSEAFQRHHEELLGVEMAVATAIRLGKSPRDVVEMTDRPHYTAERPNEPTRNITFVTRDLLGYMVICTEFHSRNCGMDVRFDRLLAIFERLP